MITETQHMLELNDCFRRNYECDVLDEMPSGERFYYPGASTQSGSDGPIARVIPNSGDAWVGVFAYGKNSPKDGATGLFSFPDPDIVCIVARGDGYLVRTNDPSDWKAVEVYPICAAVPIASRNIVVFANHTELTAVGASGVVWKTKRLAWSEMKLLRVTDDFIDGETWDIRSEENVSFRVDLSNGEHTGGIVEV